ncbi:putative pentatricopeptide repeat-containing protein At5g08310, mitochondrial isoform X3 [Cucurbita maxima]|uniref:Pentatricopeptide repeat-containing protein At5g08310, mitochondrial isoform X3 n=1 Tax=Cucurbita maxima TaxID=3661 RepID=A0A6J1JQU8_CUCMA|nr:putative pentatricopeptide repeat-containing protein At5g08310, mitochondrial isoform X3 [Cucurbita maxima]
MALSRITFANQSLWKSVNFTNSVAFISVFSESLSPVVVSQSYRPICSDAINVIPSHDESHISNNFISLFSQRKISPDDPELKILAPRLNTQIVENVLNGLRNWKVAHMFFIWASKQHGYRHNCYTFNVIASILSHARQNAPLRAIAMDVINSRCSMTPGALGIFLRCLGSVGLVEEANFLFDQVRVMGLCVPNSYTYNCLLEILSKANAIDSIENRLREMKYYGCEVDKYTLTPVLKAYCNTGKFDKALNVYNDIHERGWIDGYVFSILVLAFSKWGEVDRAMELIERTGDQNPWLTEKTFYALIHGFVKESREDMAIKLLEKMKKLGFPPDISIYDVLIGGLCKKGSFEKAMTLFWKMKLLGITPDIEILAKLIASSSEERAMIMLLEERPKDVNDEDKLEESYKILRDMKQSGLQPTHFTHNSIFGCLCRREDIVGATELLREMRGHGHEPWIKHSTLLVKQLCKNGRVNEACNFLGNMVREGFLPDIVAYSAAMDGLVKIHEVDRAFEMFQDICTHGYQPDVVAYNVLINGLCKSGRVNEAEDFLNKMIVAGLVPTVVTYNLLIDGWCKSGDIDQAIRCLSRMNGENREPTIITYTTLIDGCCNSGRPDDAEILWNEMQQKGCFPNRIAYMAIVHGLCKCGRPDEALVYYHRMEEKEMKPDSYVSVAVIDALVSKQNFPMALNILEKMVETGKVPDPADKNYVTIRDAIFKLSEDERTGPGVRSLIEKGSIPTISISDLKR